MTKEECVAVVKQAVGLAVFRDGYVIFLYACGHISSDENDSLFFQTSEFVLF